VGKHPTLNDKPVFGFQQFFGYNDGMKTYFAALMVVSSLASVQAIACDGDAHAAQGAESKGKPSLTLAQAGGEKAVFQVKGMMCKSCEKNISAALKKVEGVKNVTFHKKNAEGLRLAEVSLAPGSKVSPEQLAQAIEGAGYHATVQ
jgi:copper chaperone CopZ